MKRTLLLTLSLYLLQTQLSQAQSKIFKEISEDMSSQIKTVRQDGSLVGYVIFTQLEKASADSFNYKVSILDENLNDIGAVNFRDEKLNLQAVSFEQDVLCLAYLRSNVVDREFRNGRQYRKAVKDAKNSVLMQFLGLNGKIIKSQSLKVNIKLSPDLSATGKKTAAGSLKQDLRLSNIPQKGFVCFFGDEDKNNLLVYNAQGNQVWQRNIKEEAEGFAMLTSGTDIYLLLKKKEQMMEGGFELLGYSTADSTVFPKYVLKDKQGNSLKALAFDNDPATGKPFITGYVINPDRGNSFMTPKQIARGTYTGVFTINVNGHKKGDITETFSYWGDGSQSAISKRGLYSDNGSYARYVHSFRDYQGNTYFTGSSFVKKTRWGIIISSVITAPLIVPPMILLANVGTQKCKIRDAVVLQQTQKGNLNLSASIPANNTSYFSPRVPIVMMDQRSYYTITNIDTKTNYLVLDDVKDIVIYNVDQKKVARRIQHRDGNIVTFVYPAKEGHLLVSEYNKKEKYTRFSIESL